MTPQRTFREGYSSHGLPVPPGFQQFFRPSMMAHCGSAKDKRLVTLNGAGVSRSHVSAVDFSAGPVSSDEVLGGSVMATTGVAALLGWGTLHRTRM